MSDTTQGEDLFREAIDAPTLDKFENPQLPPEPAPEAVQHETQPQQEEESALVPSHRLREVNEARRNAEREIADLRARLAAYEVVRQQPQQPQQKLDVFDNPSAFVQQEIRPLIDQLRAEQQTRLEQQSADNAVRSFGKENVDAAYSALAQGMQSGDPNIRSVWQYAMNHYDPFGVITRWHMDRQTLHEIGGDLQGYNQRLLAEALKNPDFMKQAIEAAKGQAQSSGRTVNRPAQFTQTPVPNIPSLSDIGQMGADDQSSDPSDEALFRAVVSAKRRS